MRGLQAQPGGDRALRAPHRSFCVPASDAFRSPAAWRGSRTATLSSIVGCRLTPDVTDFAELLRDVQAWLLRGASRCDSLRGRRTHVRPRSTAAGSDPG
jgi:hypothetical protein